MYEEDFEIEVTLEELEAARRRHVKELRQIEKMSDEEFEIFKKNFSLGSIDESITRSEALALLRSMIAINLQLQQEKRREDAAGREGE